MGLTQTEAKAQGIKVEKGLFPWAASDCAIANGRDACVTQLLFEDSPEVHTNGGHGKILGGGMVGTHAGDMIGDIALAIEMGADAVDIGTHTPRWAKVLAWRLKWRTALARICRLARSKRFGLFIKNPVGQPSGFLAMGAGQSLRCSTSRILIGFL